MPIVHYYAAVIYREQTKFAARREIDHFFSQLDMSHFFSLAVAMACYNTVIYIMQLYICRYMFAHDLSHVLRVPVQIDHGLSCAGLFQ